eukprot:UN14316
MLKNKKVDNQKHAQRVLAILLFFTFWEGWVVEKEKEARRNLCLQNTLFPFLQFGC